eukprot:scaffold124076_cov20-Tisochrysis_lutea.AAC.2
MRLAATRARCSRITTHAVAACFCSRAGRGTAGRGYAVHPADRQVNVEGRERADPAVRRIHHSAPRIVDEAAGRARDAGALLPGKKCVEPPAYTHRHRPCAANARVGARLVPLAARASRFATVAHPDGVVRSSAGKVSALVAGRCARPTLFLIHPASISSYLQATHRRQRVGGDVDDEDEDEAERAREKQSKLTPFSRVRIDPAKERQKITEWARKRQVGLAPPPSPSRARNATAAAPSHSGGAAPCSEPSKRAVMRSVPARGAPL